MNASAAGWHETGLAFDCAGERLAGVLAGPAAGQAACDVGVVVVVGGPQYRAGSHRLFVRLARALAADGVPTLRFDVRGMGDSTGTPAGFEALDDDIAAAIDSLQAACPTVRRVVLWGLCDGASAALLYVHGRADDRVAGLCLFNPWVRSETSLARTQVKHYYAHRLGQREFWAKLVSGRVAGAAVRGLVANLRAARRPASASAAGRAHCYQDRMADGWSRFRGKILLVLSGEDYTAREFGEYTEAESQWGRLLCRPSVVRHPLPGADHTFSSEVDKQRVQHMTSDWLSRHMSPGRVVAEPEAVGLPQAVART